MAPTTANELITLINQLPNKPSSGHDNISNILLKQLHHSLVTPLEILFNMSLRDGIFPDAMKQADVVPLYKKKEKFLTDNYRPISLLICISKILKR